MDKQGNKKDLDGDGVRAMLRKPYLYGFYIAIPIKSGPQHSSHFYAGRPPRPQHPCDIIAPNRVLPALKYLSHFFFYSLAQDFSI